MRALPLFPLFLLLIPSVGAVEDSTDATFIDEDWSCVDDEVVFTTDVVVRSGARMVLEDCVLRFDPPDYPDVWLSGSVQGLTLRVEEGASLEVRSVDGDAGLAPLDRAYAYSLLVEGDLTVQGTPEHPVQVSGLEGYITELDVDGGIKLLGGTATLDHVAFNASQGPALFVQDGAASVSHASVRKTTGAFAVVDGSLDGAHLDADTGVLGLIAHRSQVSLHNATFVTNQVAIQGLRSDVVVTGSDLAGGRTAFDLTDTNLTVSDTRVRYGDIGAVHKHADAYPARTTLSFVNSSIEAVLGRESTGIWDENADVRLVDTDLLGFTSIGINLQDGAVVLEGGSLEGTGSYHALLNRPRMLDFDGTEFLGDPAQGVVYAGTLQVTVLDDGAPVENATVDSNGFDAATNADGLAGIVVAVPVGPDGTPLQSTVPVTVTVGEAERTWDVDLFDESVRLDLAASSKDAPGVSWPVLALAALGLAYLRRRG